MKEVSVSSWKGICCTLCGICDLVDWNWNFEEVEDICGSSGKKIQSSGWGLPHKIGF